MSWTDAQLPLGRIFPLVAASYFKLQQAGKIPLSLQQQSQSGGSGNPIVFEQQTSSQSTREHPRLRMREEKSSFRVKHNLQNIDILALDKHLDNAFMQVVRPVLETANDDDLVAVTVEHKDLDRNPIFITFTRAKNFDYQSFTNKIFKVSQSNTSFLLDGLFDLSIFIFRRPSGGSKPRPSAVHRKRKNLKCLVQIQSTGLQCGFKAVYLANYRRQHFADLKTWKRITDPRNKKAEREVGAAVDLMVAQLNSVLKTSLMTDKELEIKQLELFATYFNTRFVVISVLENEPTSNGQVVYVTGASQPKENTLFLELVMRHDGTNHYNIITSPAAYLGTHSFCFTCFKGVSRHHRCEHGCKGCNSEKECQETGSVLCDRCGTSCFNEMCLKIHKESSYCKDNVKCPVCEVTMQKHHAKEHECLTYLCRKCGEKYKQSPHYCLLKPIKIKEPGNVVMVAFDVECLFETRNCVVHHVPILLQTLVVCNNCYQPNNVHRQEDGNFLPLKTADCPICGTFNLTFRGRSCIKDFCTYLYHTLAPQVKRFDKEAAKDSKRCETRIRVVSHYGSRYDMRFILNDLFDRNFTEKPNIIMQGTKLLCIDIGCIRYQDSYNFFMAPLKSLPSTFNFKERVAKGDFPFHFNTPENQGYVGPTPPLESYGYEYLKPEDQPKLLDHWKSIKDRTDYNLQEEMERYCFSDTEILLIAMQEFRKSFMAEAGFDPVWNHFTLPSLSFACFRSKFLADVRGGIGVTPIQPYGEMRKHSILSQTYFDWLDKKSGSKLCREYRIGRKYADAFDRDSRTAYEVYGCFYHGHSCIPWSDRDAEHPRRKGKTVDEVLMETHQNQEYYSRFRINLTAIWECDIKRMRSADKEMNEFMKSRESYYKLVQQHGHIDLRDAFMGGRTEPFRFATECKADESIDILDFCSLYPSCCEAYPYPLGHPKVINSDFESWIKDDWIDPQLFGFVKCRILPPKHLRIPILPQRFNERLEFVLCRTCAATEIKKFCTHSDEDRALIGTWATPELQLAIDHGYRVLDVIEILHWEKRTDTMFKPFVRKFITLKAQASGYPSDMLPGGEDQFIETYHQQTGIRLEKDKIKYDPVLRAIAKYILNSFFGRSIIFIFRFLY